MVKLMGDAVLLTFPVVSGPLGPPGEERYDIVGDALNQLFKAPWGDFELSPEVQALLD